MAVYIYVYLISFNWLRELYWVNIYSFLVWRIDSRVLICQVCWAGFLSTWNKLEPLEKKPQLKSWPHQIAWWVSLWYILLIDEWGKKAQIMGGGTIPRQVALDGVRKQVEKAMGNKLASSISPWPLHPFLSLGSYLEFLPWLPSVVMYELRVVSWKKPFPLQVVYGHGVFSQ